jgi:hypothetical protein
MAEVPIALMLPCSVVTDANAAIQGVFFATNNRAAGAPARSTSHGLRSTQTGHTHQARPSP